MADYDSISPDAFGAGLRGLGLNILVTDVRRSAGFLSQVFGMQVHRLSDDFAIVQYGDQLFQLHADATYASHPLHALLPETPPRGLGLEIRLYDSDPETAAARTEAAGGTLLAPPQDKPHGLRETFILDPDGYCWVASRPK
ncbi:VOC family protein [Marinovum sp.]|uniref:VOC family protein n=1 Tax=Marinovum sp. TaxID=2024839 RepID=UPI002B276B2E|nr:VOC family protein [Marinovum sp.]